MSNYAAKKFKTNQLFPRTGFITGMGSVLNIAGGYYRFNYSKTEGEVDAKAIASDWGMIGQDMQQVLDTELSKSKAVKPNGSKKEK